jgi:hypothetical protein
MSVTNLIWSGKKAPPAIGDEVTLYVNGCGKGRVTGYLATGGYLGVWLELLDPPAWYLKQNGGNVPACAFGIELEPREPKPLIA